MLLTVRPRCHLTEMKKDDLERYTNYLIATSAMLRHLCG